MHLSWQVQHTALSITSMVPLYYLFAGISTSSLRQTISATKFVEMCSNATTTRLKCVALPHYDVPYAGETLRQLHQYCWRHPTASVVYIQSQLPNFLQNVTENAVHNTNLGDAFD
jgi:hypothetical protein